MALDGFCDCDGKLTLLALWSCNLTTTDKQNKAERSKAMAERREGHFKGFNSGLGETELFFQTWTSPRARGTLVITHGISEHSECYAKTAESLVARGWNICAWDLRGHGRSEGKRGFVENFRYYGLDLGLFLRFLKESGRLSLPFALIGHSMGGLITLRHLLDEDGKTQAGAIALSSPLLGFGLTVPAHKDLAARVLNRFLPGVTLFNEIRYDDLTRDREWLKTYPADTLRHDKISPALYLGMIENMAYVRASAAKIRLPILIQAAGKEKIVSRPAIEEFFPAIGSTNKKLIIYEDSYHEIYNDLDREKVFTELDAFLGEALGLKPKP